jgi:uncharacterized protein (TIGR02145 family)
MQRDIFSRQLVVALFTKKRKTNMAKCLIGVIVCLAVSCEISTVPTVQTLEVSEIEEYSATCGGIVTSNGGSEVAIRGVVWNTTPLPTLSNCEGNTYDGQGIGMFDSRLDNLSDETTYYVRAYATNSKGTGYGNEIEFTTPQADYGTFIDSRDGNTYKWVRIGTQIWMAENLKYIPFVCPGDAECGIWVYDYYETSVSHINAVTNNYLDYGCLYSIAVFDIIVPDGWHIPTTAEWQILIDYVGGEAIAGKKLKEAGTAYWKFDENGTTNEFGFSARGGGKRNYDALYYDFDGLRTNGYYWTSSTYSATNQSCIHFSTSNIVQYTYIPKLYGGSIRCLKDE